MAYNIISGSILAAQIYSPMTGAVVNNILSGNLSTSDGANIRNVPRLDNAISNAIVTNVDGDYNRLTTNGNLTFDGSTLSVVGDISVNGSLILKRHATTANYIITTADYYIGADSTSNTILLTLPTASTTTNGQTFIVKDEGGNANNNNITISCSVGADKIDGQNLIILESPYASLQIYCDGTSKYFIF